LPSGAAILPPPHAKIDKDPSREAKTDVHARRRFARVFGVPRVVMRFFLIMEVARRLGAMGATGRSYSDAGGDPAVEVL